MPGSKQAADAGPQNERRLRELPRVAEEGGLQPEGQAIERLVAMGRGDGEPQGRVLTGGRLLTAQRQALAAHMGQTRGNQYLQRAVLLRRDDEAAEHRDSSTTFSAAIQRSPDGEFVPVISCDPDRAVVLLGNEITATFRIDNASDAPAGTTFQWDGGLSRGDALEFGTLSPQSGSRTTAVRARAVRPGVASLQGNLVHQVPGGPEVATFGPEVAVWVRVPTVDKVALRRETDTGEEIADTDRMRVGEYLVVQIFGSGLSERTDLVHYDRIRGEGSVLSSDDASQLTAPGTFRMRFRANAVGAAHVTITVMPEDTPESQGMRATVDTQVEMGKDEFLSLTNQVNTVIDLADRSASAWLASIALAYGKAYKTHTDLLKGETASRKLRQDLILGAALAFIPGGAGGLIGGAMRRAKAGDFVIDGIKDLAKWGMRTGASTAASAAARGNGLNAYPTDPVAWKGQEELRISSELAQATRTLLDWQNKAHADDPNFYMDFNPVDAMTESLSVGGYGADGLQPVDQNSTADAYERGMWTAWLGQYGYTVGTTVRGGPAQSVRYHVQSNVGKDIARRCEALGLNVEQYAGPARERAEAEAEARNQGMW